jgi:hypothetical protein
VVNNGQKTEGKLSVYGVDGACGCVDMMRGYVDACMCEAWTCKRGCGRVVYGQE